MKKGLARNIALCVLTGASLGLLGYAIYESRNTNEIYLRTDKKVESGYINPKRLDITLEDQNKNGEKEVVLRYNLTSYALMEDKFGNPVLKRYEVKPEEYTPAKITPPRIIIKD